MFRMPQVKGVLTLTWGNRASTWKTVKKIPPEILDALVEIRNL